MPTCAFCGISGKLTGEHVLGDWLSRIGLALDPVLHGVGPLNRIGRELGVRPPFRQTVRDVCGNCNHGWMSRLEVVAQRVLTPFILGKPGQIDAVDNAAIAAWAQKTVLTAMLVSSEDERARGYGLPVSEYYEMYALGDMARPLPASQFWIGRYTGFRSWSIRVTPLAVRIDGLPEPDRPQGYAMTIVLGQLVLHGIRFTTPSFQVGVSTSLDLPQLWPPTPPTTWPGSRPLDDDAFLGFAGGKHFRSTADAASGSSHWNWQRGSWIICLNPTEPRTRRRFTLFHEYKHILDHGSPGITQTSAGLPNRKPVEEVVADYFAGCVLMPKRLIKAAYYDGIQRPAELAELFDVSEAAMNVRLSQLGLSDITAPTHRFRYQPRPARSSHNYWRNSNHDRQLLEVA